jgi:hypothetical protein
MPGNPSIAHGSLCLIEGQGNTSSSATMTVPHYLACIECDLARRPRECFTDDVHAVLLVLIGECERA